MIRVATLMTREAYEEFVPTTMNTTRWLRMSEALARLGYQVDMVVNSKRNPDARQANLRRIPHADFDWRRYDVIKTLFHKGFDTLAAAGGAGHPFIISKLGSVVGASDDTAGVYFFNHQREQLYASQLQIGSASRFVTLLTDASRQLWEREHGHRSVLMVPTGVDSAIPPPGPNPYQGFPERIAIFIGNLYRSDTQGDINLLWQGRLNRLGRLLKDRGMRLCVVSVGTTDRLDPEVVTCLGTIGNDQIWDYQYFAHVGLALAQGPVQHNESSKIYYYLRAGLPVVSEAPIPNSDLIGKAGLGLVAGYGDDERIAELVEQAAESEWDRHAAMRYMVDNHSWDSRARVYDELIRRTLA